MRPLTVPQDVEVGAAICEDATGLRLGRMATGGPFNVSVPLQCPMGANLVGVFHTHPGGVATPSGADIAEAQRLGLQYLGIGVPDTGESYFQRIV